MQSYDISFYALLRLESIKHPRAKFLGIEPRSWWFVVYNLTLFLCEWPDRFKRVLLYFCLQLWQCVPATFFPLDRKNSSQLLLIISATEIHCTGWILSSALYLCQLSQYAQMNLDLTFFPLVFWVINFSWIRNETIIFKKQVWIWINRKYNAIKVLKCQSDGIFNFNYMRNSDLKYVPVFQAKFKLNTLQKIFRWYKFGNWIIW